MCTQAEPQTGQIIQPVPREQRYSSCCSFGYVHTEVWTDRCTLDFLHIFLEGWFTLSPLWLVSRFHVAPEQRFLQQWQTRYCGGAGQWVWKRICHQHWDDIDSNVTCRELGFKVRIETEAAPMRWCTGFELIITNIYQAPHHKVNPIRFTIVNGSWNHSSR